jgi:hypothetical protein
METAIEKRHLIYTKAKELYLNEQSKRKKPSAGMCWAILMTACDLGYEFSSVHSSEFRDSFPELMKLKPKKADLDDFWWPKQSKILRLNRFDTIIEQTNKKK